MYDTIVKKYKEMHYMKINTKKLRCYRKRLGLSSQEFAFVCDIPVGTYFSYEAGLRNPKPKNLNIMASKLNVSIDDLTSGIEDYTMKSKERNGKTKEEIMKERVDIDCYLLRNRRKQLGIKAEYIAEHSNLSVSRYREYERGLGRPTREKARKMCDILNLKFYELVIE